MSNYPAKFLPVYLVVALIFLSIPGFCAQNELTKIQKQAVIYRQQGWRLQEEGKINEALTYYQKAMLMDPSYVMAYNDAGVIFEALGYPEQAKQMYLKAVEIDPSYPDSYSNLALLYEEEKDYTNAILCWIKRATFGGSSDAWAEVARERLEDIARLYPEAYRMKIAQPSLSRSELRQPQESLEVTPTSEVSLFREQPTTGQMSDNKSRALKHLTGAKESFARGQYVAALKEATLAEYFDSSNAEISAFLDTVRRKLLK